MVVEIEVVPDPVISPERVIVPPDHVAVSMPHMKDNPVLTVTLENQPAPSP